MPDYMPRPREQLRSEFSANYHEVSAPSIPIPKARAWVPVRKISGDNPTPPLTPPTAGSSAPPGGGGGGPYASSPPPPPPPPNRSNSGDVPPPASSDTMPSKQERDLEYIMALPFEVCTKGKDKVLRADMSKLSPGQLEHAQTKLAAFGISSHYGDSSAFAHGCLKVDGDTKKFEDLQTVFLKKLKERNSLAFGKVSNQASGAAQNGTSMTDVVRINMDGMSEKTKSATVETLSRLRQDANLNNVGKPKIDKPFSSIGTSGLFPDSKEVVKIEDPGMVAAIAAPVLGKVEAPKPPESMPDYRKVLRV